MWLNLFIAGSLLGPANLFRMKAEIQVGRQGFSFAQSFTIVGLGDWMLDTKKNSVILRLDSWVTWSEDVSSVTTNVIRQEYRSWGPFACRFTFYMRLFCVWVCVVTNMPKSCCTHWGQRRTCGSWFSPTMRIKGIELRFSGFGGRFFYLMSHVSGPFMSCRNLELAHGQLSYVWFLVREKAE